MKIAHISDTHLGFRAFSRTTDYGWNQREFDVMETFHQCLDAIRERDPDIVVHSGDLFHMVRPSNATIVAAYRAFDKFQRARDARPFVLIGGNHDTPKLAESGNILRLFSGIPGLRVLPVELEAFELPELDVEVLGVPSQSVRQKSFDWLPQLGRKHRILTVHGLASQAMLGEEADFDLDETRHDRWTYVALGDFHKHQAYGSNVCYAGSTDYTSSNIWEESATPKGWVWFDTEVGKIEFVACRPRPAIDLPAVDATDLTAEELTDRLVASAKWDAEMPMVRQVVRNVRPEVRMKLGIEAIRSIQARALDYRLLPIAPEMRGVALVEGGRSRPLEATWAEHAEGATLPQGVSRGALKQLGLQLLEEVKEIEAAPIEA